MMHFEGRNIVCQSQQLMTETNSKNGFIFFEDLSQCVNRIIHRRRIARPVRNEITRWIEFFYIVKLCFCREHFHKHTAVDHTFQDMLFDTVIHHGDANGRIWITFLICLFRAHGRSQLKTVHVRYVRQFLF